MSGNQCKRWSDNQWPHLQCLICVYTGCSGSSSGLSVIILRVNKVIYSMFNLRVTSRISKAGYGLRYEIQNTWKVFRLYAISNVHISLKKYEPCQAKRCLQTCVICADPDHSAYAHNIIRAFDQSLRCTHIPGDMFSHRVVHIYS